MTACFGAKVVGAHADQQGSQRIAIHGLGEWFDDFAISLKWWTGNVVPDTKAVAPETGRGAQDRGGRGGPRRGGGDLLGHRHRYSCCE